MLRRPGAVARGRLVGVGHEAKPARAPVAPHDDAARHAPEALEVRPELAVAARVREAAHEELAVADVEVRGCWRAVRELPPCSLRSRRRGAPRRRPPRRAVVVGIGPAEAVPDLARRRSTGRSARRSARRRRPAPPEPLGRPTAWRAPHVVAWRRTAVVAWRAPHVVAAEDRGCRVGPRRRRVAEDRGCPGGRERRRARQARAEARRSAGRSPFSGRGPAAGCRLVDAQATGRAAAVAGRASGRAASADLESAGPAAAAEAVVAWRRAAVGAARRRRTEAVARWAPQVVARRRPRLSAAGRGSHHVGARGAAASASVVAGPVARRAPPVITARRAGGVPRFGARGARGGDRAGGPAAAPLRASGTRRGWRRRSGGEAARGGERPRGGGGRRSGEGERRGGERDRRSSKGDAP